MTIWGTHGPISQQPAAVLEPDPQRHQVLAAMCPTQKTSSRSLYLCIHLSIHLSIYLFVYLYIYLILSYLI